MTFAGRSLNVTALAGGVGGAKLAQGLAEVVEGDRLRVIVNTADDFILWGLHISPDIDTVLYTLGGIANPSTGWGIADDTRSTLDALERLGIDPWFQLGDQDFATHIFRTCRRAQGATLTDVTAHLARQLGVECTILPMSDDPVATMIETPDGQLAFQEYFVARRQKDEVIGVSFSGIESAAPTSSVVSAFDAAEVIVLCPSNPLVSIGPILATGDVRSRLQRARVPRVAVSPLVGGRALKGPADRMMASLGLESSSAGIARFYAGLIDILVIDEIDADDRDAIEAMGIAVLVTRTVMGDRADRARLAREVLQVASRTTAEPVTQ